MAIVYAKLSMNFDAISFNEFYQRHYDAVFDVAAQPKVLQGGYSFTRELDYAYSYSNGSNTGVAAFLGNNLTYDSSASLLSGGTVTGMNEFRWDAANTRYADWWGILGISLSATAVRAATLTRSTADDDALLTTALSGNDTFSLSDFADRARGYAGNDIMVGNGGSDRLYGGAGNDRLSGGNGNDILYGESGTDRLIGGRGNDVYVLAASGDSVTEAVDAGTDTVKAAYKYALGSNVENLVLTGSNAIGGSGNSLANKLTGNAAANVLNGLSGHDQLSGAGGNDVLQGRSGRDVLIGGSGKDVLAGGTGNDAFQFNSRGQRGDLVTDFSNASGNDDYFRIDASSFGGGLTADDWLDAGQFRSRADNLARDADDRFIFRTTDKSLWFDADGRGGADAIMIADLQADARVTAADIWLF